MDNSSVKRNISQLRRRFGLTQEEMAEKLGISRTSYRNIESGPTVLMHESLVGIGEIFGVSLEELVLGYKPDEHSRKALDELSLKYGSQLKETTDEYEGRIKELTDKVALQERLIDNLEDNLENQKEIISFLRSQIDGH